MIRLADIPLGKELRCIPENFWELLLRDEQLSGCDNLEKLVAGCEIIAAIDDLGDLLAA